MATGTPSSPAAIVPAQVGFLAVFNPSLGHSDETLDDQIVYYSSVDSGNHKRHRSTAKAGRGSGARPTKNLPQAERNERLRQIGLAQGMVNFGKSFSDDQDVDTIETEKTRVVLHELEPGWWILAVSNVEAITTVCSVFANIVLKVHRFDKTASSQSLEKLKDSREPH